jgi:PIN domain nuclease of toxin-antitoxin system
VDDPLLPEDARHAIGDRRSVVHVSAASLWEISLKQALGRVKTGDVVLVGELATNGFVELPISAAHAWLAERLPPHHDDLFDRLLVAQAKAEDLVLVSKNPALSPYDVQLLG